MSEEPPRVRFGPLKFPERYGLPPRPAGAAPAVQDAHRQTQFLLSADLELLERAMNLQLRIAAASARARSPQAFALLGLWSRAFAYLADACALLSRGSYPSCFPLLRSACDAIAAQRCLIGEGFQEYLDWLPQALSPERERAALAIALGRYRAGSVLAEDPRLGAVYRPVSELSMPHFGATLLQTGPETSRQRLVLTFADSAFHLGWAELIMGWLLTLADVQLDTAVNSAVLSVPEGASSDYQRLSADIAAALARPQRCRVEELDGRFLLHNFRRAAGSPPRRVILGP